MLFAVALPYSFSSNHSFPGWWSVPTFALKSPRRMSLSDLGAAEITEYRSS